MENREIIIEPVQGQWTAFYPGERYNRVTAATPEAARTLLGEMLDGNVQKRRPQSLRGIFVAGIALLLVGAAATSLALKGNTSKAGASHTKWAHHQHHKHHR